MITCSVCDNKEEAEVSEDDYAFMRHANFTVDSALLRFNVVQTGRERYGTKVKCGECGAIFHL